MEFLEFEIVLLCGFAGAFRRSELVGLDRDAVEITRDGLAVTIRRSKTDQESQGRKIGERECPELR
jgi:hypothetical protein